MNDEVSPSEATPLADDVVGLGRILVPVLIVLGAGFVYLLWHGGGIDLGPVDGPSLYRVTCARCHGAKGEGIPPAKTLLGKSRTVEEIKSRIREGGQQMPPFSYLSPEKQDALAGYVKALGEGRLGEGARGEGTSGKVEPK